MRLVKVGAAVLNQTPLDWRGNTAHIVSAIEAARREGVRVLCLPELCICGYGCEDAFYSAGLRREARRVLEQIIPHTAGMFVAVGLPVMFRNSLFNTVCVIADGVIRGFVAKQHLAGEGLHYEPRWFKPWPSGVQAEIHLEGHDYPIGDLFFDVDGIRIGFEICEDAWVANRPGRTLADRAIDIILNPSASHFAFGKSEVRKRLVLDASRAFAATYVYSNLLGNEAGRAIYDGSALIASNGELVAATPRFSYADHLMASAVVDIDATRRQQSKTEAVRIDADQEKGCIPFALKIEHSQFESAAIEWPAWEMSPALREEEFTRAVTLALFDYMRKSRSNGFVVSLSGGADSSAVACLVALMVWLGIQELGMDGLRDKLAYLKLPDDPSAVVAALLTTVYQSTENSSDTTRDAARSVAEAIGSNRMELDLTALHHGYLKMIGEAVGRNLTWEKDDLALQNIQARVRAPGVWMLANLKNALLLSTSNRSEAAVGYATMDGDTCGGLSPIAGASKAFIRQWLRWMETSGPSGIGPIAALGVVNGQQPTAELRPSAYSQTDEADLMPYDVLDAIEDAAIGEKQTPVEVFQVLRSTFPDVPLATLILWIERFFRLWCRNQWKRERYAPSLHLDDRNLDPKTWCRFPILSGGFEVELQALRELNHL